VVNLLHYQSSLCILLQYRTISTVAAPCIRQVPRQVTGRHSVSTWCGYTVAVIGVGPVAPSQTDAAPCVVHGRMTCAVGDGPTVTGRWLWRMPRSSSISVVGGPCSRTIFGRNKRLMNANWLILFPSIVHAFPTFTPPATTPRVFYHSHRIFRIPPPCSRPSIDRAIFFRRRPITHGDPAARHRLVTCVVYTWPNTGSSTCHRTRAMVW